LLFFGRSSGSLPFRLLEIGGENILELGEMEEARDTGETRLSAKVEGDVLLSLMVDAAPVIGVVTEGVPYEPRRVNDEIV